MLQHADMFTIGQMVKRLKYPIHRIEYVIASRRIEPVRRAGAARLFAAADVAAVAKELKRIDAVREGRRHD